MKLTFRTNLYNLELEAHSLCESSLSPSTTVSQSMFSRAGTSLVANLETIRTDCRVTDVYRSEDKDKR